MLFPFFKLSVSEIPNERPANSESHFWWGMHVPSSAGTWAILTRTCLLLFHLETFVFHSSSCVTFPRYGQLVGLHLF